MTQAKYTREDLTEINTRINVLLDDMKKYNSSIDTDPEKTLDGYQKRLDKILEDINNKSIPIVVGSHVFDLLQNLVDQNLSSSSSEEESSYEEETSYEEEPEEESEESPYE